MLDNPLGQITVYKSQYDPSLLFPIPRDLSRKRSGITDPGFKGFDVWNCYELGFLDEKGKPEVRRCTITYSSDSVYIVESKSLKLYLNSFNMTRFENEEKVIKTIVHDLNLLLKTDTLKVVIYDSSKGVKMNKIPINLLLDNINVDIGQYELSPELLTVKKKKELKVYERYSNLLKTNCPITGQPDWATLYIKYKSIFEIEDASLLKYIISFRNHNDYHESCCEKIFYDLFTLIKPEILIVKCFFTRRGGIDINPCRFFGENPDNVLLFHYWRQ